MIYYTQLHLRTVDMSQQLELDEQSKEIATINSQLLFTYHRLPFDVSSYGTL